MFNVDSRIREFLTRVRELRDRLVERFAGRAEPVLAGLLESLLADAPTACNLVGLRSPEQVAAAVASQGAVSPEDAAWVRELYAELA